MKPRRPFYPDLVVFWFCLLVASFLSGMSVAAESDEKKFARLALAKQERRAVEVKYEACAMSCRETCK